MLEAILFKFKIDRFFLWDDNADYRYVDSVLWDIDLLLYLLDIVDDLIIWFTSFVSPPHLQKIQEDYLTIIVPPIIVMKERVRQKAVACDSKYSKMIGDLIH